MATRRTNALDEAARNTPLQRLARKAGAKRVSGMLYRELRGVMSVRLGDMVKGAVTSMLFDKRKSLQLKDVELALEQEGLAYGGLSTTRCKIKTSKREGMKKFKSHPELRLSVRSDTIRNIVLV